MTPADLLANAIIPALKALGLDSLPARHMLLTIALQESGIKHRQQVTADGREAGPAVSFWQFEKGNSSTRGGVTGLLMHASSGPRMRLICSEHGVVASPAALWEAMRTNDILGAAAARLLLYTLPNALPRASVDGWNQYVAAWRPGKPKPHVWKDNWDNAAKVVYGKS